MPGWKTERVAELVREIVASTILNELRDPRLRGITVTRVEVSNDLRHAKVYVSIMGGEAEENEALRGLQSASRYLQAKLGKSLRTKHIPRLRFVVDRGVKHSIEVSRILRELEEERHKRSGAQDAETSDQTEPRAHAEAAQEDLGTGDEQ